MGLPETRGKFESYGRNGDRIICDGWSAQYGLQSHLEDSRGGTRRLRPGRIRWSTTTRLHRASWEQSVSNERLVQTQSSELPFDSLRESTAELQVHSGRKG